MSPNPQLHSAPYRPRHGFRDLPSAGRVPRHLGPTPRENAARSAHILSYLYYIERLTCAPIVSSASFNSRVRRSSCSCRSAIEEPRLRTPVGSLRRLSFVISRRPAFMATPPAVAPAQRTATRQRRQV